MTAQRLISKSTPAYRSDNRGPRTFTNDTVPEDEEAPGLALEPVDKDSYGRGAGSLAGQWCPGCSSSDARQRTCRSSERSGALAGARSSPRQIRRLLWFAGVIAGGLLAVLNQPETIKQVIGIAN